jgi:hypothetical protein
LRPEDVTPELCEKFLQDAALVYFDGRLTEAAFVVARAARAAGIPILVEAERLRPDLDMLMAEADFLVTSTNFPEDWTGEDNIGDAMLATALRLPALQFMVCCSRSSHYSVHRTTCLTRLAHITQAPSSMHHIWWRMFRVRR